jgi:hypothetical protein
VFPHRRPAILIWDISWFSLVCPDKWREKDLNQAMTRLFYILSKPLLSHHSKLIKSECSQIHNKLTTNKRFIITGLIPNRDRSEILMCGRWRTVEKHFNFVTFWRYVWRKETGSRKTLASHVLLPMGDLFQITTNTAPYLLQGDR